MDNANKRDFTTKVNAIYVEPRSAVIDGERVNWNSLLLEVSLSGETQNLEFKCGKKDVQLLLASEDLDNDNIKK